MNRIEKALDYLRGFNREKINVRKAVELLEEEKDNPIALCWLVACGKSNPELLLKYKMCEETFYRLLELQDDHQALNCIGYCYDCGFGVEQDLQSAMEFYRQSSEQGNNIARYNLGLCYRFGTSIDLKKATELITLSAEQGDAVSQNCIGHLYDEDGKICRNLPKAIQFYTLSAEQGYSKAQYNLGICYKDGIGVEQDSNKALELFTLSAKQGHTNSQKMLDIYYPNRDQATDDSVEIPDMKCIICMTNAKNTVFLPCRHVVSCLGCTKGLVKKNCPLCRKEIKEIVKLFL